MSLYNRIYIFLTCLFCATVITGNVVFQKFIIIHIIFLGDIEISAGVLLYPITFLISDLITEIYGKKMANYTVSITCVMSILVIALISITSYLPASTWSKISDHDFNKIFNFYGIGTVASIIAIYLAQLIDIAIFSWIRKKTKTKYLWLRNNVSTIISQFVDTSLILLILCLFDVIAVENYKDIFIGSMSFKILAAIIDTPFCYLGHYILRNIQKNHYDQTK